MARRRANNEQWRRLGAASSPVGEAAHATHSLFGAIRLREALYALELQAEDRDWQQLSGGSDREFSVSGLRNIMKLSRLMFLKNPLINLAVTLQARYVWGQGCQISSDDTQTQQVIDDFLADNRKVLTGHQARIMCEQGLQVQGNLFFVLFDDPSTGRVAVRTIPPEDIEDILTDPEDGQCAWLYKRVWAQRELSGKVTTRTAYYPAIDLTPAALAMAKAQYEVQETPVLHVRVGGLSDMRMGVPEYYQALDWARAYKGFLEDWASINKALARFAWSMKTPGGQRAVTAAKTRLGTTVGSGSTLAETNPPSTTGATFISSGAEMTPMKTSGATTSAEEGRRLLLMVAAATGLPETFFGDVSVGTLATAKSLDRPTELKFKDRQELWKGIYETLLQYAVARSRGAANGVMFARDNAAEIKIAFPDILEHDIAEQIGAIVSAATLDGKPLAGTIPLEDVTRMVGTALGVQDVEALVASVVADEEERQAKADAIAAGDGPAGDETDDAPVDGEDGMREAIRELREALVVFAKNAAEWKAAA